MVMMVMDQTFVEKEKYMYLDSRTSSKLLPWSQTFSRTLTFRW